MKEVKFICCQPDDLYYIWQVHLWLENLKTLGHLDKAIVLLFVPNFREYNVKWNDVMLLYPEATFRVYKDEHEVSKLLGIYIPILRPYLLMRWWKDTPDMKDKAVLYYDNDVLLTDKFNIDKYIDDDICYVSDTNSYINASYFDSKIKDVKPDKLEDYKKIDVLDEATKIVGVTRQIAEKNNLHSGGAQYLLKNIDADFWDKMMSDTIKIRLYLMNVVNKTYFESESKGTQSWCSDMFALLWGLWARGQEVKVIKEMDFAWAPDPIEKLNTHPLYHNAGITGELLDGVPYFYKGKYHTGSNPFIDPQLQLVINDERSKKKCTWFYANALNELGKKYKYLYE
jgi:hypothetical protein